MNWVYITRIHSNWSQFATSCRKHCYTHSQYGNIETALAYYTGFTEAQITALMKPGVGPKIQVVNLVQTNGKTRFGEYDRDTKTLKLHAPLVNGLDAVNSPTRYKALVMLMTITILHEFVFQDGIGREAGWVFETNIKPDEVDGIGINRNNAIEWVKYYEYDPN